MSLSTQLTIYAATIAAMLTFMRLISGISGSQMVRMYILKTAFISTAFIVIAGFLKILLNYSWFSSYINQHAELARNLSTSFFLIWTVLTTYTFAIGVIVRLYVRTFRFKDWGTLTNIIKTPLIKLIIDKYNQVRRKTKEYENTPLSDAIEENAKSIWSSFINDERPKNQPTIITGNDPWHIRKLIIEYCVKLAQNTNEDINYICCNVSPSNIWNIVKENITDKNTLNLLKNRLVFVDAYTTTFGFQEEILLERLRLMQKHEQVDIVTCHSSAGIHSGTSKSFNILKKKTTSNKGTRNPCTVIYDTISAMSIPETEDEVSEFIIHLSAAELAYEMHTIFIEADLDNRSSSTIETMRACCGSPIMAGTK
jgi:hypothetical protein